MALANPEESSYSIRTNTAETDNMTIIEEAVYIPKGMVLAPITMLENIRAQLEADRLIEQGRAMKGEVTRCPVRQMCRSLDEMISNTGEGA
jgi:hypothetical protein